MNNFHPAKVSLLCLTVILCVGSALAASYFGTSSSTGITETDSICLAAISGNASAWSTTYNSSFVLRNQWTSIDSYPTACTSAQYVSGIGDTLTCQSGASLTNLNANNLASGTVSWPRLSQTAAYYRMDPLIPNDGVGHDQLGAPTIGEIAIPNGPSIENKIQFNLPTVEYTFDGVNWVDANWTETEREYLMMGRYGTTAKVLPNMSSNLKSVRFTWDKQTQGGSYVSLNWFNLYYASNGATLNATILKSNMSDNTVWIHVANKTGLSNWPGILSIPHAHTYWRNDGGSAGQARYYRVVLDITYNPTYQTNGPSLYAIWWYGYYPANAAATTFTWTSNGKSQALSGLEVIGRNLKAYGVSYTDANLTIRQENANQVSRLLMGYSAREWEMRAGPTSDSYAFRLNYVGNDAPRSNIMYIQKNGNITINGTLQANDYYSGDGTQGMTGTCAAGTTLTVKDGLITGCV